MHGFREDAGRGFGRSHVFDIQNFLKYYGTYLKELKLDDSQHHLLSTELKSSRRINKG